MEAGDPWFPSAGNDLSPGLRPQKPQENSVRSPYPPVSPSPHPKAFPNTEQLSSNCVSRLAQSLDPSATVIPLQALGLEPFVYTRTYTRTALLAILEFLAKGMLRQDSLDRTHPIHPCAESNGPRLDFLSEAIQRFELRAKLGARESESYRFEYPARFSDFYEEDEAKKLKPISCHRSRLKINVRDL